MGANYIYIMYVFLASTYMYVYMYVAKYLHM